MGKTAILVHGWVSKSEFYDVSYPTASNLHWFPWLTKQLTIRDIHTVALEMPRAYYPEYEVWKRELERFGIGPETVLVGHSCGGGFLVRYLSENDVRVGKVVLVAPWLGYDTGDEPFDETFFKFDIDAEIARKTAGLTIIASTDDEDGVQKSVAELREKLVDFRYVELENRGHFTRTSLGGEAFPELLEEILGLGLSSAILNL